jgi:type IX secretion system PorP/SprF family membrane protein
MKKTLLTIISGLGFYIASAQQEPLMTQYAFNQVIINPGVAGTHDGLSMTAMSRIQWNGLEGAPQTHLFSAHAAIPNKNMGVGITFTHDRIGLAKQNEVGLLYSYQIDFGFATLSAGLRGNFNFFNNDLSESGVSGDPNFQEQYSDFGFNFGTGLYLYNEQWYAGVSAPYLNTSTFEGSNDASYTQQRIFYIMGGYVFDINGSFKVKPYTNVKIPVGAPINWDINASLIYDDKIYLGAGYRPGDSFSVLFEWQIQDNLRLGYASDIFTNDANQLGGAAQEFMINYVLPTKKDAVVNPRYF